MEEIINENGKYLVGNIGDCSIEMLIEPSQKYIDENTPDPDPSPEPTTEEILLVALQEIAALRSEIEILKGGQE